MKDEYDFSKGIRGKFYQPDVTFRFPIYLDDDVDKYMSKLSEEKNMEVQALVNEWLRTNIKKIEAAQ